MIMQTQERSYTVAEYLEFETQSDLRHEYRDGAIAAMTGGTPNHNQLALNFSSALNFALKRQPYRVFVSDQRLWIPERRIYTYPDVMLMAQPLEFAEGRKDTLTNPLLIAEVLSKSTRSYDKDEKFAAYRTISSLQDYLLVDQYTMHVEHYSKTAPQIWTYSEHDGETAALSVSAIAFQISLADLYDKVDFAEDRLP